MTYYEIPVNPQPAQAFSFINGDNEFVIRLKTSGNVLYMDLTVNGDIIFEGLRCDAQADMLELFAYKEIPGRLFFLTENGLPPYWERLGTEDKLYYAI